MAALRRLMGRGEARWVRKFLFVDVPGGKRWMSTHGTDWALVFNAGSSYSPANLLLHPRPKSIPRQLDLIRKEELA
jgi:hypothetical protein